MKNSCGGPQLSETKSDGTVTVDYSRFIIAIVKSSYGGILSCLNSHNGRKPQQNIPSADQ